MENVQMQGFRNPEEVRRMSRAQGTRLMAQGEKAIYKFPGPWALRPNYTPQVTRDEGNTADGRFPTASFVIKTKTQSLKEERQ